MATAQQPICDSIVANLKVNSALNVSVGGRIYNELSNQDPIEPFILFSIPADVPQSYFQIDDIQIDFQVDVYGQLEGGTKGTRVISDAVYALLHRSNPTISGYTGCSILCEDRGRIEQDLIQGGRTQQDAWRVTQIYRLRGTGTS